MHVSTIVNHLADCIILVHIWTHTGEIWRILLHLNINTRVNLLTQCYADATTMVEAPQTSCCSHKQCPVSDVTTKVNGCHRVANPNLPPLEMLLPLNYWFGHQVGTDPTTHSPFPCRGGWGGKGWRGIQEVGSNFADMWVLATDTLGAIWRMQLHHNINTCGNLLTQCYADATTKAEAPQTSYCSHKQCPVSDVTTKVNGCHRVANPNLNSKRSLPQGATIEPWVTYSQGDELQLILISLHKRNYMLMSTGTSFCKQNVHNKHIRTHTGEKPYACKYCFKSFHSIMCDSMYTVVQSNLHITVQLLLLFCRKQCDRWSHGNWRHTK